MKKLLSLALLAGFVAVGVVGCSSEPTKSTAPTTKAAAPAGDKK